MKRQGVWRILALSAAVMGATVAQASSAPAHPKSPQKTPSTSDVPLAVFQRIDNRLTVLDADSQALRIERQRIEGVRGFARRTQRLHQIQRSSQSRERLRAMNQLTAISSSAEQTYRRRHQEYGTRLFRDLHTKIVSLREPMVRAQAASTTTGFDRDENLVDTRLLSVIMQFQAISGGYAALACSPGSWACCRPRIAKDGKLEVRGCNWSCASKLTACRGGCLGPRIPNSVVAVKNATPRLPEDAQRRTLAANQLRKTKPTDRVSGAAHRQAAATGNE